MNVFKKVALFLLLAVGARANAASISCGYLTQPSSGAPFPGLSRPQVTVTSDHADVEIVMEAGRGTVSRVDYSLAIVKRSRVGTKYQDPTRQVTLVTTVRGAAMLNVKGLTAQCR